MKFEYCQQIFEIFSDIQCHENLSSGSRVVPYGLANRERQEAANSSFSQFSDAPRNKQRIHNILNVSQVNGVEHANTCLEMLLINNVPTVNNS